MVQPTGTTLLAPPGKDAVHCPIFYIILTKGLLTLFTVGRYHYKVA
jgi:hypothetical protein